MNMISKYKLENIDQQTIVIPLPARILSAAEQNNDIVLYSIIDDEKDVPTIPVDILIKGTGDVVENNIGLYTFIGTVKLFDGKRFGMYSIDIPMMFVLLINLRNWENHLQKNLKVS